MSLARSPLAPKSEVPSTWAPLSPAETKKKIEMYSTEYWAACAAGGALSCGSTHTAIVSLDMVKCRLQVDKGKYKGTVDAFKKILAEEGVRAMVLGWAPTLIGYSAQGLCKFGFYEYFKKVYADAAGPENAIRYKDWLYLSASASAEVIADVALVPWEAVKVRIQTSLPGSPSYIGSTLRTVMPGIVASEGVGGLYKSLVPLWGRQVPYTMMKFWAFERTVQALYQYVVPKPRAQCNKGEQLAVSFAAGYIAGVFCAVVSHPADTLVSKLNQVKGATIGSLVGELGFWGLWKGLPLRIIMIGTLTGLQWGIYDGFKTYVGLPTTGAAPAPAAPAKQ